jgi:hypothetical protein
MWLFTRYGFYSVAKASPSTTSNHKVGPDQLMLRARTRAHLENLQKRFGVLAAYGIEEWPARDFRFRLIVGKETWVSVVAELVTCLGFLCQFRLRRSV